MSEYTFRDVGHFQQAIAHGTAQSGRTEGDDITMEERVFVQRDHHRNLKRERERIIGHHLSTY